MKLKSLHIHRGYTDNGPLRGEIVFRTNEEHEMKIALDEQLSVDLVRVCADAIVRAGQYAAKAITSEAMQATAIEHQPE